jgi:hypothetical protein
MLGQTLTHSGGTIQIAAPDLAVHAATKRAFL